MTPFRKTLPGLLLRLLGIYAQRVPVVVYLLFVAGSVLVGTRGCDDPPDHSKLVMGTFNIENFPKDQRQVEGAFALIDELDLDLLAVQEITDPRRFADEARERLGQEWSFVSSGVAGEAANPYAPIRQGVMFDTDRLTLLSSRDRQLVHKRGRPALEARFKRRGGSTLLRVIVVHFKSGTSGRDLRARQFAGLRDVVREAVESGDHVVVMGDFNATEEADRADLDALSAETGLSWATRDLACSAFWRRTYECPTSRLDHVLTWEAARDVRARGACETEGCDRAARCPLYREQVSDHCPVTFELD